jgi:hypothetical protein
MVVSRWDIFYTFTVSFQSLLNILSLYLNRITTSRLRYFSRNRFQRRAAQSTVPAVVMVVVVVVVALFVVAKNSPWCAPKWRRLGPTIVDDDDDTRIVAIHHTVKLALQSRQGCRAVFQREDGDARETTFTGCSTSFSLSVSLKLRCAIG